MIEEKIDIYLLHCETFICLKARMQTKKFEFLYSMPPDYEEQIPLFFNLRSSSSKKIDNYQIIDDELKPNKLIKFNIKPLKKQEKIKIHFDYFVIIKNNRYKDLPKYANFPDIGELPEETKIWLKSTEAIQANNFFIKFTSIFLKSLNKNMIYLLKKILYYTPLHRFILQNLRIFLEKNSFLRPIFLPKKYWTGLCDAVSYLIFGGHCTGQANFAAALLRALGIPTKILIVSSFGLVVYKSEKIWFDSKHYIIESFCPGYGWIKSTPGKLGYQTKNYIISRIVYPDDENIAGNGLSYYGGMEPWFWINNENVVLEFPNNIISLYKKPLGNVSGVPAHRLSTEGKINVDNKTAERIFFKIRKIWNFNSNFNINKIDMDDNIKNYYNKGIIAQKNSLNFFNNEGLNKFEKLIDNCIYYFSKIV